MKAGGGGAQCACFHIHLQLCPRGGLEQRRPRSRGGAGFQTSALLNCLLAEMAEIRAGATQLGREEGGLLDGMRPM